MHTRMALAGLTTTLVIAAAISACSGSVETQPSTGASTSGSGGSSASSGTTTATASTSGGQGGGAFCGGKAGIQCPPGQFCAFDPPGSCGDTDGGGTCTPGPDGCTADCPGVCGCDGAFYCNACGANAAGQDVSSASTNTCLPDAGAPAIYSAEDIITNVPRFAIFKADPTRDVCFRLVVEGLGGGPSLGISTPAGWSIGLAEVTDHASDCVGGAQGFPAPPLGKAVAATGGSGKIDFPVNGPPPCLISIHAKLTFPPGAPFVPAIEPLDADMLSIGGGCPP